MSVFVTEQDRFAGTTHAMGIIVALKAGQACEDGGVVFRLGFFGAQGVVGDRVKTNGGRLIFGESKWYDSSVWLSAEITGGMGGL